MFNFFTKQIDIPTNETVESKTCVQLWKVEWRSRHGNFNGDTKPEMEGFTSEEEAIQFKKSLDDAFKLIKHTSGNRTTITKN